MASTEKETKSNRDRNNSIRIVALHKLYQDDGISYYPSKSTSIFEQGSSGPGMLPDEIQICFYDTSLNTAYSASIDNHLLSEIKNNQLKKAGSDFEVWIRETFQESSKQFSFTIVTDKISPERFNLVWKKVEGKFKIRLAELPLSALDFKTLNLDIFDTAVNQIQQNKAKTIEVTSKNDSLHKDLSEYQNKLIQFRNDANSLEKELYDAFLPILNSKKAEIRRLKRKAGEIDEYKDDTTDDENSSEGENSGTMLNKNKSKVQSQPKKCHTISDSDEDTENDNFGTEIQDNEVKCDSQDFLDMSPTLL